MNIYEQICKASCQCIRCARLICEAPNQEHGYQQRCQASGLNVTFQLNKRFNESCPVFIDTKPENLSGLNK